MTTQEYDISFDTDAMDKALNSDGLDWTFEKPTSKKYSIIYIIEKEFECHKCEGTYNIKMFSRWEKGVVEEEPNAICKDCVQKDVEEYECEQCSVEVKTEKDLTITYGCMDMKFCEDCYKTSKEDLN